MSIADWVQGVGLLFQAGSAVAQVNNAYTQAEVAKQQTAAQKLANEAQAKLADNNATLAGYQANDAFYRGEVAENNVRVSGAQLKGKQIASLGASGITLDSASSVRILSDTDLLVNQDALTQRDNAARQEWALNMQKQDYQNRAAILRATPVATAISPGDAATATALTQASSLAKSWYQTSKT